MQHLRAAAMNPRVVWSSEHAFHLDFACDDLDACAFHVARTAKAIEEAAPAGVLDLTPASTTILVLLDPFVNDVDAIASRMLTIAGQSINAATEPAPSRTITIPVCYDEDLAPDLADIAAPAGLTPAEAAALHSNAVYTVQFLGFSPGFAYIAGLPSALHTPRLDEPRPRVRAGSIGIANARTAIYPHSTPGGWRLIGASPLRVFDPNRSPASLLTAGDGVRFVAITRDEYENRIASPGA